MKLSEIKQELKNELYRNGVISKLDYESKLLDIIIEKFMDKIQEYTRM